MDSPTSEQPGGSHTCLENTRSQFPQQTCFQSRQHSPGVISLPRQKPHQTHLAPRLSPPLPRLRAGQHTWSLRGMAGHCGSCGHLGSNTEDKQEDTMAGTLTQGISTRVCCTEEHPAPTPHSPAPTSPVCALQLFGFLIFLVLLRVEADLSYVYG